MTTTNGSGPVDKALWCIEYRLDDDLTLAAIAAASGVSRYHLTRAFGNATGYSVMRYLRARRLSVAARALAAGAPDILAVALAAGYGSHEAFTRAFCGQFGVTPEQARTRQRLDDLPLLEPLTMGTNDLLIDLEPPRIERGRALLIAGFGDRFTIDNLQGIPGVWQRFLPYLGRVPGQIGGNVSYGVCCNGDGDGGFDYIAGVEVSGVAGLRDDFRRVRIQPQTYAVFAHRGHISGIRATYHAIWNRWLPQSRYRHVEAPDFERYDAAFTPENIGGQVEIWVPVSAGGD